MPRPPAKHTMAAIMATAESMSLRDMVFWLFLALFGTSTEVIYQSQGEAGKVLGVAMIVVGFIGMVGCAWPLLRDPLTGSVQLTWGLVSRIIHHPLYRKAAMRLIVAYVAIYALVYLHSLRSDLDMYVMPRTISERQSEALREYLSKHEAHAVTVRVNPFDAESLWFASQVSDALKRTNWDVAFDTSPVDPKTHLNDGLSIDAAGGMQGPILSPMTHKLFSEKHSGLPILKSMATAGVVALVTTSYQSWLGIDVW